MESKRRRYVPRIGQQQRLVGVVQVAEAHGCDLTGLVPEIFGLTNPLRSAAGLSDQDTGLDLVAEHASR
jgi:hypothetical protein